MSSRAVVAALAVGLGLSVFLGGPALHSEPGTGEGAYGVDVALYATVRRSDGSYRRMLASVGALEAIAQGEAPPEGTRILMETYYRPGEVATVYHMRKVEGRWRYGAFSPEAPDLSVRARASCLSCHVAAGATDMVFTLPSLRAFASTGEAADFACDRGGRTPCGAEVYSGAAK